MSHFILTGAPGAGKTAVLRELEVMGQAVVEEAATDVIALAQVKGVGEPHLHAAFIDDIVALQERRRREPRLPGAVFHDRSPICTLALAQFLGFPVSGPLAQAVDAIQTERFYERKVFFLRNLGFIVNTQARRISFDDTLRFEKVHEEVYREMNYELVYIDAGPVEDRAVQIITVANQN